MSFIVSDEQVIDAVAIRMLDLGMKGEYSYKNSSVKTDKQKNMKRDVKNILTKLFSNEPKKNAMKLIFDALLSLNNIDEIIHENKQLKEKICSFENKNTSSKEIIEALYKDELREQLRTELDQDREEAIESSRRVNRRLMDTIKKLEEKISQHKSKATMEEYEMLRNQNLQMTEIIDDLRGKVHLNKKALEIQKILELQSSV